MVKLVEGTQMGCTDGGDPEHYTEYQLSRVVDAHQALENLQSAFNGEAVPLESVDFWTQLPRALKMDVMYTSWTYREVK